jgi:S1-C subfamily serine protease
MKRASKLFRRPLVLAVVLLASTAVLGFAQGAPGAKPGQPSEPGVLVIAVQNGSPAEKAGLVRGDIILDINSSAVNSLRDAQNAISSYKQGDTISVKVRHGDAIKTLSVVLGDRDGRAYMGALLLPGEGVRTGMLGPGPQSSPPAFSGGALVEKVASGGPAAKAGITKGDVILSVDGTQITANDSLKTLIQDKKIGDVVTLSVLSPGESTGKTPHEVKVALGSTPDKKKPWLGIEYEMGFPTALLAPWSNFPPLAGLQMPQLGGPMPGLPSLPGLGMPGAPEPVV